MKRTIFGRVAAVAAFVASAVVAQPASAQIIGTLNISGDARIFQTPTMTPEGQIVVDFLDPAAPPIADGHVETTSAFSQTGIFAGLGADFAGRNVDFVLGPFGGPNPGDPPPQTPPGTTILSIDVFDFVLTNFENGTFPGYPFNVFLSGGVPTATLTVRGQLFTSGVYSGNFVGTYSTGFPQYTSVGSLVTAIENGATPFSAVAGTFVVSAVPEPATVALMATGLVALVGMGFRRRVNG